MKKKKKKTTKKKQFIPEVEAQSFTDIFTVDHKKKILICAKFITV